MNMLCLRCGDCCRGMSPRTYPLPCPHLVEGEHKLFSCDIYHGARPQQCIDHKFNGYPVCPIGCDVLDIHDVNQLAAREALIEKADTDG